MEITNYTDHFDVMLSPEQIQERTKDLAKEISNRFEKDGIVAVGILRGCFMFYSDLLRFIECPTLVDFMFVSSYGDAMQSSGRVKIERDLQVDIKDRNVLLIDDIVDTGLTLYNLKEMLQVRKPKSIQVCTMLNKVEARQAPIDVEYSAYDIENHFVVGYGLDYRQYFRNMGFIGKLKDGHQDILDQHIESVKVES